jgi:hypothetical protein
MEDHVTLVVSVIVAWNIIPKILAVFTEGMPIGLISLFNMPNGRVAELVRFWHLQLFDTRAVRFLLPRCLPAML